ncbi:MAG: hypothetical protein L0Y36_10010 [Planctomycetales bacterium]|nr:hypothetical protein [Planctomycetales bacterium]
METSKNTRMDHTKTVDPNRLSQNRMDVSFPEEARELLPEKLLEQMQSNPLGRLLKVIAGLPEVRAEKIEQARRHVECQGDCWDTQMDVALDRVLEELITEE